MEVDLVASDPANGLTLEGWGGPDYSELTLTFAGIPEPATVGLLGLVGIACVVVARKRVP